MMRKHYHICEKCFKFMRDGYLCRVKKIEEELAKLKKEIPNK